MNIYFENYPQWLNVISFTYHAHIYVLEICWIYYDTPYHASAMQQYPLYTVYRLPVWSVCLVSANWTRRCLITSNVRYSNCLQHNQLVWADENRSTCFTLSTQRNHIDTIPMWRNTYRHVRLTYLQWSKV